MECSKCYSPTCRDCAKDSRRTAEAAKAVMATARSYGRGSLVVYEQCKRMIEALNLSPEEHRETLKELAKVTGI